MIHAPMPPEENAVLTPVDSDPSAIGEISQTVQAPPPQMDIWTAVWFSDQANRTYNDRFSPTWANLDVETLRFSTRRAI